MQRYIILILIVCLGNKLFSQETRQIDYKADAVRFDKNIGNGAMRLIDNVQLSHAGALMYCDSAYLYNAENRFEAFNNVEINQGDTMQLFGDYLEYEGEKKLAKIVSNVVLQNNETNLYTNVLDYDLSNNVGYYQNGADIISSDNKLRSKRGYYYADFKYYLFKDSVVLINPDYTIYSDTLKYDTENDIAYFYGPTDILSDSNTIYCENGWYNIANNTAQFEKNNKLENEDQIIWSDYLYYERETGYGLAKNNITIFDKYQDIILKGNYAVSNQYDNKALITDSAMLIEYSEGDTMYLHADTLKSGIDTANYRILTAHYNVRIYRSNMQAVCDSLAYSFNDSVIRMYYEPVLWSEENQLFSDNIEMLTSNNTIYQVNFNSNAFIVSQQDTNEFNQIKGKNMVGHLKNNAIHRIDVLGNGQLIYYVLDDKDIIGVNKAVSSDVIIYLENKKIDRINLKNKAESFLYPLSKAPKEELTLSGFKWLDKRRPINKDDIFRK